MIDREVRVGSRLAIATRRGYCDWAVDRAGLVVVLMALWEYRFHGKTIEEAIACAWLG